jgi:ubiquinone/menaquinone biosynthesis C-methylase UbiE/uncharacterized protein YbaR (Trm112 family)
VKASTVKLLISPETGNSLSVEVIDRESDEIITGRLIDEVTGQWFRLENGIPELTPAFLRNEERLSVFCKKYGYSVSRNILRISDQSKVDAYNEQISFFRNYQEKYETEVVDSPFYRAFDQVIFLSWVKKRLSRGQLVVEVGCGSGRQSLPLVQFGCQVIGVDLSEEMLNVARRKVLDSGGGAEFIVATSEYLPIRDDTIDAALIFGSLHHFPDPAGSVSEVARLMKMHGNFLMVEPHDSFLRPLFDYTMRLLPLWKEEAADEPLFSAKQWNDWFGKNGLNAKISYSTILPPHLFYLTGHAFGAWLLKASDSLVNLIPGVKRLGGVIVADACKMRIAGQEQVTKSGRR